jgi:hypothetical protein
MKKSRSTLKEYFQKGAIPTESNYADLIDSMLNQEEDNVFNPPNDPLSIKAVGEDESLINFYRVGKGEEQLAWQIKQNPDHKPGLSFHDASSDTALSKLFIQSGTGNVGIGTASPDRKLEIAREGNNSEFSLNENLFLDGQGGTVRITNNAYVSKGGWAIKDSANKAFTLEIRDSGMLELYGTLTNGKTDWRKMATFDAPNNQVIFPSGNVGIGKTDPKARLEVDGPMIRKVAIATGLGPNDGTDKGQIKSRILNFTKLRDDTALRIIYCDNLRIRGYNCSARWEIRIDGKAPPNGAICQDKYHLGPITPIDNVHEPTTIIGHATGIRAGRRQIQVWVVNPVPGHGRGCDAYTGWNKSRWTIEAQEVWL